MSLIPAFELGLLNVWNESPFYANKVGRSATKSKTPTTYAKTQKITVNCQILLLLAANSVDPGRHNATSHVPKISVATTKKVCKLNATKVEAELKYGCMKLLYM